MNGWVNISEELPGETLERPVDRTSIIASAISLVRCGLGEGLIVLILPLALLDTEAAGTRKLELCRARLCDFS